MALEIWGLIILVLGVLILAGSYILRKIKPYNFINEVTEIAKTYGGNYPRETVIFYGSSSIRMWDTLEEDIFPLKVLRHGFGGSRIEDATKFAHILIYPFNPKAIVLYSGTNNINGHPILSQSGKKVFKLTVEFFKEIHSKMPSVPIYYISATPNKFRWHVWSDMEECNRLVREYCEKNNNLFFIDTVPALLSEDGKYREELFQPDNLHFNKKGYQVWTNVIKPVLLKGLM